MRHARPDDLVDLQPLLEQLRGLDGLVERTPGSFYRRGRGFLHFHVDGDRLFCDVKLTGPAFERVEATTRAQQRRLLTAVKRSLAPH
jgi:hypothetical protein